MSGMCMENRRRAQVKKRQRENKVPGEVAHAAALAGELDRVNEPVDAPQDLAHEIAQENEAAQELPEQHDLAHEIEEEESGEAPKKNESKKGTQKKGK